MPPEMSPEIVSVIGVGIALLTVIAAFAGLLVTLLPRMDRRTTRNIESTNARIDRLTDEVRAIAQAQVRTAAQIKDLTEQTKESVAELQTVGRNQSRPEGEVMIIKDAFLLRAMGQE